MRFGQVVGAGLLVAVLGVGSYGQQDKKADELKQQEKPKQEEKDKQEQEQKLKERIGKLIEKLDDDEFKVRKEAQEELEKLGGEHEELVDNACQEALKKPKSEEQKMRLQTVLECQHTKPIEETQNKQIKVKIKNVCVLNRGPVTGDGNCGATLEIQNLTDKEIALSELAVTIIYEGKEVDLNGTCSKVVEREISSGNNRLGAKEKAAFYIGGSTRDGSEFKADSHVQVRIIFKIGEEVLKIRSKQINVSRNTSKCTCGCKDWAKKLWEAKNEEERTLARGILISLCKINTGVYAKQTVKATLEKARAQGNQAVAEHCEQILKAVAEWEDRHRGCWERSREKKE